MRKTAFFALFFPQKARFSISTLSGIGGNPTSSADFMFLPLDKKDATLEDGEPAPRSMPKGPFRTKNAMALKSYCCAIVAIFYYLYRFAAIFPGQKTASSVVSYYRGSDLLSP